MTIVGGVFLAVSLILMLTKTILPVDPAWLTVIICGYPLIYLAITRIIHNKGMSKISSALLISIAMIASIIIGELFAAGEVAFIMAIGGILEDKTAERAQKGIKELIKLAPDTGRLITNGQEKLVAIEQIKKGDILRVLPGETIPVDGLVISGNSSVDQSIMTGESLPIDKEANDEVFCGTINRFGSIDIKATKVGEDSSLQKLIRLVKEAENSKAPTQRIVDKWAAWLVPIALIIALLTYLFTLDIIRAVTILVVFCPCALALATPTSIMAAIGQATKHGVIIKSGEALENMGKVNIVAFDKTGTLTHGNLMVSDVISFNTQTSNDQLLALTASIERHSEHPLGKAIVAHSKNKKLPLSAIEHFEMIPGKGVAGTIDGEKIYCGNMSYLAEMNITTSSEFTNTLNKLRKQGKAIIIVFSSNLILGIVALSDTIRNTAKIMIQKLSQIDVQGILLTGDHAKTADYFAKQVGIETVYSELLPEQKVAEITKLQREGKNVCMIGDGVNDAPALKTANVGVAMGAFGSDIAIEAADIALMGDDISKVPYLKKLSTATVKLIKINIMLSMAVNFIAIILSIMAILNPITGALVHNVSSVLIVLNAVLLYDRKYD